MKVEVFGITDVGLERTNNEDAFLFCHNLSHQKWDKTFNRFVKNGNLGTLSVVADGMGGGNAGEIASSIAIKSIKNTFTTQALSPIVKSRVMIKEFLLKAIADANKNILKHVDSKPETMGMGTTIVILWIIEGNAYIAWCGDSRCYVFNHKIGLKCLTKDHSYVQELLDNGEITLSESYNHPYSSVITRCLGDTEVSTAADIMEYKINLHDQFILCSDGLCGYCDDKKIEKILYEWSLDSRTCCRYLTKLALTAGGEDNITVVSVSTISDAENRFMLNLKIKVKRLLKRMLLR